MAIKDYRLANDAELKSATAEIRRLGVKAIGIKADIRDLGPMKKAPEPADIAHSATFLASDDVQFVGGKVMNVAAEGNARYTG